MKFDYSATKDMPTMSAKIKFWPKVSIYDLM